MPWHASAYSAVHYICLKMAIQSMHHFWELTIRLRSVLCVCVCQVAIKSMDQFWELTTRLREEHSASAAAQQHSDRCECVCIHTNTHTHTHTRVASACESVSNS